MQILHPTTLNDRDHVNKKGHEDATISSCPNHPGGGCAFHRHGTYSRKTPYGEALIARYYCRESHQTFSLLPLFFAARMPGTPWHRWKVSPQNSKGMAQICRR